MTCFLIKFAKITKRRQKKNFGEKRNPTYVFKNINCEDLDEERQTEKFMKYTTIKGSLSLFSHQILKGSSWKELVAQTQEMMKKTAFFYKESIVYPFVQMEDTKKGFQLSDDKLIQSALFKA